MPSLFDRKEDGPYENLNMPDIIDLLKGGADIEATDSNYNTPLVQAAYSNRYGVLEHCEEIIKLGANINAQGRGEYTALCYAVINENEDLCKFLIEAGADVTICSYDGENVYFLAAAQGLTNICKMLIDQGKIDKDCTNTTWRSRENGANALMYAAHGPSTGVNCSSQPETCRYLLEAGLDINANDDLGQTALYYAVGTDRPGAEETAKLLMEAGADLNIVSKFGTNALWRAGYSGLASICQLIIEQGGDIPIVGDHCDDACVRPGVPQKFGNRGGISKSYTALMIPVSTACDWEDPENYQYRDAVKLIKLLVEAGSDVNAVTETGTAWSLANGFKNEEIMKLLEDLGAKPQ